MKHEYQNFISTIKQGSSNNKFLSFFAIFIFLTGICGASTNENKIFEPTYFPISSFQYEKGSPQDTVRIPVKREVFDYCREQGEVAVEIIANDYPVPFVVPIIEEDNYDQYEDNKGNVWLGVNLSEHTDITLVVVTNIAQHRFPIVTHWKQSSDPNDRGGFSFGGTDSLKAFAPDGSLIGTNEYRVDPRTSSIIKGSDVHMNLTGNGKQTYNKALALFEDPNAVTVSHGLYIGENYSINKPSDLTALLLAHQVLEETGFPVLFLNFDDDPYENIPMFQVINSHIVEGPDSNSSALATFFLPPYWNDDIADRYAIAVNGQYDLHERVYHRGHGFGIMKMLNDAGKEAIGIIWNNGGSLGPIANHRTYFDNAHEMFEDAKDLFAANWTRIIAFGGSRGGAQALALAANPYYHADSYRVKTAICVSPPCYIGDLTHDVSISNHPALASVSDLYAGYFQSWVSYWEHPDTGRSNKKSMAFTLTGNPTQDGANSMSAGDLDFINSLKDKGTEVVVSYGTNDSFFPTYMAVDYIKALRDAGVEVKHELAYRNGHGGPGGNGRMFEQATAALKVIDEPDGYLNESELGFFPYKPSYSPLFSVNDFVDPDDFDNFILKLKEATDPVSQFLQSRLKATKELLNDYGSISMIPSEELQAALIDDLNKEVLLVKASINDFAAYFAGVTLRQRTTDLIELLERIEQEGRIEQDATEGENTVEGDLHIRLKRYLLEDAYPEEIAEVSIDHSRLAGHIPLQKSSGRIPLVCELPAVSYSDQSIQMGFYGSAGTRFKLKLVKINSEKWDVGKEIVEVESSEITVLDQTLPDLESEGYDLSYLLVDATMPTVYEMVEGSEPLIFRIPRYWLYKLEVWDAKLNDFKPVEINQTAYALNDNSQDSRLFSEAVLEVFASEADLAGKIGLGKDFSERYGPGSRGMGISNDQQFNGVLKLDSRKTELDK